MMRASACGQSGLSSSGDGMRFAKHAARFLGEAPPRVEHIAEHRGRLTVCPDDGEPLGQFVRT